MLSFGIKVAGQQQLSFALKNIPLRDCSEWWPTAIRLIRKMIGQQKETEGARGPHGKWAALSPEYAKQKARKYPGQGILERGAPSRLWESLLGTTNETVREIGPNFMRFGTRVPYALFHQLGYEVRGRTGRLARVVSRMLGHKEEKSGMVPARRIFDFLVPDDTRTLQRSAMSWAATKCRRAGFRVLGSGADPGEARRAGRAWYEMRADREEFLTNWLNSEA